MKKVLLSIVLTGTYLATSAGTVMAFDVPSFSSCPAPGGEVIASYETGTHGVPGDYATYSGSDAVYSISTTQNVQCLCVNGSGIQTNWLQVDQISQQEIDSLKNQGWIFIPDGSVWGLKSAMYMAKNNPYSCNGGSAGSSQGSSSQPGAPVCTDQKPGTPQLISVTRNGATATIRWTEVKDATHYALFYGVKPNEYIHSVPNTGKVTTFTVGSLDPNTTYYWQVRAVNTCMPGEASGSTNPIGGGEVLGASTPEFANTGDSMQIVLMIGAGLVMLGAALYYKSRREA